MFVQPAAYAVNNEMDFVSYYLNFFEISETGITSAENAKVFTSSPKHTSTTLYMYFPSLKNYSAYRVVLRKDDGWLDPSSSRLISTEVQDAFKFETIKDSATGEEYLVSACLSEITNLGQSLLVHFGIISLLKITEPIRHYPYDFNSGFVGWWLIVYPFICFVKGLAFLKDTFLYAKTAHLSQSSGYGKTRLCIEFLQYSGSGIYCVYRDGSDTGYPKTTPWMQLLVDQFRVSQSDEASVNLCLSFICWAINTFSSLENMHYKFFLGEERFAIKDFPEATVDGIKKALENRNQFTFIIDECQELIRCPDDNKTELISLYRALNRAMNKIKDLPVVMVFLGTKSSLGDFVLSGHYKPSFREEIAEPHEVYDVPMYLFTHSCNSMATKPRNVSFETVATFQDVDEVQLPHSLTMEYIAMDCGRPLWRQYAEFRQAFDVARLKLSGDKRIANLASLILRTGSSVVPQDMLAHELVLSGMATLTYVDSQGSRCFMEYVPEPMLSNNARLQLMNRISFVDSLQEYIKKLECGVFHESGEAGELVARIILLRAMDLSCLCPKRTSLSRQHVPFVKSFSVKQLFGATNGNAEFAESFADLLDSVRAKGRTKWTASPPSPTSSLSPKSGDDKMPVDVEPAANDLTFLAPNIALSTVREFFLLISAGRFDDELTRFGVSDEVLDGIISVTQFVKLQHPMHIDQIYLMHCFAKGCGLILADNAPGADLILPVLRTDNRMSCIVIQAKNLKDKKFPNDVANVSNKLGIDVLGKYLHFDAVGDFAAAPADDFVRIVIQFGMDDDAKDVNKTASDFFWSKIPAPEASEPRRTTVKCLWLRGLKALDHLFFFDKEILSLLTRILSARRDFYRHLDYSRVPLPTYALTTEFGARFLGQLARPLANYANLAPLEAQLRQSSNERGRCEWNSLNQGVKLLQMPEKSFSHLQNSKISPTVKFELEAPKKNDYQFAAQKAPQLGNKEMAILESILKTTTVYDGKLEELIKYKNALQNYRSMLLRLRWNDSKRRKEVLEASRAMLVGTLLSIKDSATMYKSDTRVAEWITEADHDLLALKFETLTLQFPEEDYDDEEDKHEDEQVPKTFTKKRNLPK